MPKCLLVYPRNPVSFWSFDESVEIAGRRSAFPPLGLLTIAGMLPQEFELRLIDENVRPLVDSDLEWADIVLTSSMIIHWRGLERIISRCNARGVPVLNGGPLPTQYHDEIAGDAVFYLGEAENGFVDVVDEMLRDPGEIERRCVDRRGSFQDLKRTPLPRWDLIDLQDYFTMMVQVTRGCPESCTFCNIPSLYGKQTRIKEPSRMVRELELLYEAGWRGSVMVVDDNFVGNQDAIQRALEAEVIPWQRARGYPFAFNTQASLRLSDNEPLLEAMRLAGFVTVFVGIESTAPASLKFMGAQKNLQGEESLLGKVRTLQRLGFEVQAGFIIGLDTDPDDIAEQTIGFIREAGIPVAMVGILGVLRDTPDYRRYQRAGRLIEGAKYAGDSGIFSRNLSFVPAIEPGELFERHRTVVETLNRPKIFFERCRTFLRNRGARTVGGMHVTRAEIRAFSRSLWRQGVRSNYRWQYWRFLAHGLLHNPRDIPLIVALSVQGHHLIETTRGALQADDVTSFLTEALDFLDRQCRERRETLQGASARAGRLMDRVRGSLVQDRPGGGALRHNAGVLLQAAQQHAAQLTGDLGHLVQRRLDQFQGEVERILEARDSRRRASSRTT